MSVRKIYIIDNRFIAVVYSGKYRAVYALIELYYKDDPKNWAEIPVTVKKDIYTLGDVSVLNVHEGTREMVPSSGRMLPFLFYPLEKFEIKYMIEKSG
jgi:hypothetical protein